MTPLKFYERCERIKKAITAAELTNKQLSSSDVLDKLTLVFFPILKLDGDLLKNSLYCYLNQTLTESVIQTIIENLVGAADWMRENKQVLVKFALPLDKPISAEIQIVDWRIRKINNLRCVIYRLRVMSGRATGQLFEQQISPRLLTVMSRKLAFSGKNKWKKHPAELIRMWFSATLHNSKDEKRLIFKEITVDSVLRSYNRKIAKERAEPCVYKMPWSCVECPVGYNKCYRGTHPETYPRAICSNTLKGSRGITSLKVFHNGYFEPGYNGNECIKCRYLKRKKFKSI